jgi:CRP-like cAMP-binding protein
LEPNHKVLFSQGEKGDRIHLLSSGNCTKFHLLKVGRVVKLGRLRDGNYFGEVAFFEEQNRHTYSVKTNTHCHLETLMYTALATLMQVHNAIALSVQASARVQARLIYSAANEDAVANKLSLVRHETQSRCDPIMRIIGGLDIMRDV